MKSGFEDLPRRIFLDSCTAQTMRRYGDFIYEGEPIAADDRIYKITNGISNLEALRNIFLINERAQFEWIVSHGSLEEAKAKCDKGHLQWLWAIADHSGICLEQAGPTALSEALGGRLNEPKFGYLSAADRRLIRDALILRCEAFLTVERRLPTNADHLERELGIRILTPSQHWQALQPWAALWR